ncbi:MAG: hypothetical protein FWB84_06730 [Candidatus Bathyarchaeota archaeon]|uniref:Kelch repeat-containing protein n=1 Tax=Candidatus Bathycorpusculum sp. TaxID=2994959 RepID=UPI0028272918|nr:hypothetical protein [Candidatus Termiticorpusculum sp.]MCL2291690.1 hypothetical protein [Candidatus Termiticorpusculum sp.]
MNKIVLFILLLFFISGTFVTMFNSVLASELVEDTWYTKTPMKYEQNYFKVVAVGDKIYAIGSKAFGPFGAVKQYDTKTDTWIIKTIMPTIRYDCSVAFYQGKIYCIGGYTDDPSPQLYCNVDTVEVYEPVTDTWSSKAAFPDEYGGYQAHVVNEQLFVITRLGVIYVYNSDVDTWANVTNVPVQGRMAFSVVVDNKIVIGDHLSPYYIIGNTAVSDHIGLRIYDPKTNDWSEGKTSPEYVIFAAGVSAGVTTGVYAPEKVYIFGTAYTGDYDKYGTQPFACVYDPMHDSWSTVNASDLGRVAVVDDLLYIVGTSSLKQYVPLGYDPLGYSARPIETDSSDHSESRLLWMFLTMSVVAIVVIVVIVISLFFYANRLRKNKNVS